MEKKQYTGSCACGRVRFEAAFDVSQGTHKCNCTSCWKRRWWSVKVQPEDFRALSGEGAFDPSGRFCASCGVCPYRHAPVAEWNPAAYVSVNVAALDDLPPADLVAAKVTYYDGLHDNWWSTPDEVRHL
ncbi:MAG: GFA family protein [Polyangiales bacterium]